MTSWFWVWTSRDKAAIKPIIVMIVFVIYILVGRKGTCSGGPTLLGTANSDPSRSSELTAPDETSWRHQRLFAACCCFSSYNNRTLQFSDQCGGSSDRSRAACPESRAYDLYWKNFSARNILFTAPKGDVSGSNHMSSMHSQEKRHIGEGIL